MAGSVIIGGAARRSASSPAASPAFAATDLGGFAIKAALERAGVGPEQVDYVFMGQVLQAGAGQITARQAAANAGIPMTVPATTVNKVCLSGLNAIYLADLMIQTGEADIVVAGGMESMTNAPYLLPGARAGYRMGDTDRRRLDDVRRPVLRLRPGAPWAPAPRSTRRRPASSREPQDELAAASHERAARARRTGCSTTRSSRRGARSARATRSLVERRRGRARAAPRPSASAACGRPSTRPATSPPATPPRSPTAAPR